MMESERNIRGMQNEMLKVNYLLNKERTVQGDLMHSNMIAENNFVSNLKVGAHCRTVGCKVSTAAHS